MARGFRLWLEPGPVTGRPAARAARLHATPRVLRVQEANDAQADDGWPLGKPWGLLLRFLNLERRVPPRHDWQPQRWYEYQEATWADWLSFLRESGAPYLRTSRGGGRRQHTWSAPVSWPETRVLESARATAAVRHGPLSQADWLFSLAAPVLHEASADAAALPTYLRDRAGQALALLEAERAELAAHPPRRGRPPEV
jgi:hypothetical protein